MKLHLAALGETELLPLLTARTRESNAGHILVANPADADMVILLGNFGDNANLLLEHPAYLAFPDKCAVYTEDDNYLPLIPGVYCSAENDEHAKAGRTFSYSYISRNGRYSNSLVTPAGSATKKYLFTFQGGSTSLLRKRMFNLNFNRADVIIENTSSYHHWDLTQADREFRQQRYADTISASHFVLCPRGAGLGSIRLFEVMCAGVAPVLIADKYLLPPNIEWEKFLLRIPERDISRLPELIERHTRTSVERGRLARAAYVANFGPNIEWDRIIEYCLAARHHGPPAECVFRLRQKRMIGRLRRKRQMHAMTKKVVLKTLKVLHIKNPYQMNRP